MKFLRISRLLFLSVWVFGSAASFLFSGQGPSPSARVGISGSFELSLRDAVQSALQNNPMIRISSQEVEARNMMLASRQGVYDPRLEISSTLESATLPVASSLSGGERGVLSSDRWSSTAAFQQDLPFGGDWSLIFDAERSTTSNLFSQLDPQYPTFLGVNLNLPLLRNRATDSRRLEIVIASRDIELGRAEFQQIAFDLVTRVRITYWNLSRAREDQKVKREGVRLAEEQLALNQRLLEAGQASGVDVVEAEATAQQRQEEWLASFELVTARENELKQLILGNRLADLWQRELLPIDRLETAESDMSVSDAWEMASTRRPELRRLGALSEIQRANSHFLSDQTKPVLDLFATYGTNGLAGQERSGGNPFSSQNDLLYERVNSLSDFHLLGPIALPASGGVPDRLQGGLGQSLSNLFSNDFRTGAVGVRFQMPLGNREIKGQLAASRIRETQLEFERAGVEQKIESEIRNSLQAVHTGRQRVQAAGAAMIAAQARLESEQRLFAAGETTNFLLLTRQSAFIEASAAEVGARMDLNIALANLQQVLGVALESFGITLETP